MKIDECIRCIELSPTNSIVSKSTSYEWDSFPLPFNLAANLVTVFPLAASLSWCIFFFAARNSISPKIYAWHILHSSCLQGAGLECAFGISIFCCDSIRFLFVSRDPLGWQLLDCRNGDYLKLLVKGMGIKLLLRRLGDYWLWVNNHTCGLFFRVWVPSRVQSPGH